MRRVVRSVVRCVVRRVVRREVRRQVRRQVGFAPAYGVVARTALLAERPATAPASTIQHCR
jgi:hypothetical protein